MSVSYSDKPELFVVEGKSAASAVSAALSKRHQRVHALQGKPINALRASVAKVHANKQCAALFEVLACGTQEECDLSRLAFDKVLILADPDRDGRHCALLMHWLFQSYLPALVAAHRVVEIIPPLFRIRRPGLPARYVWDPEGLPHERLAVDAEVTRFRGIAQMQTTEIHQLLTDPGTRLEYALTTRPIRPPPNTA